MIATPPPELAGGRGGTAAAILSQPPHPPCSAQQWLLAHGICLVTSAPTLDRLWSSCKPVAADIESGLCVAPCWVHRHWQRPLRGGGRPQPASSSPPSDDLRGLVQVCSPACTAKEHGRRQSDGGPLPGKRREGRTRAKGGASTARVRLGASTPLRHAQCCIVTVVQQPAAACSASPTSSKRMASLLRRLKAVIARIPSLPRRKPERQAMEPREGADSPPRHDSACWWGRSTFSDVDVIIRVPEIEHEPARDHPAGERAGEAGGAGLTAGRPSHAAMQEHRRLALHAGGLRRASCSVACLAGMAAHDAGSLILSLPPPRLQ